MRTLNKLPMRDLKSVRDAWLGAPALDPKSIAPLVAACRRYKEINDEAAALEAGDVTRKIVTRLVSGDIDFTRALFEHAAATSGAAAISPSNSMPRSAVLQRGAQERLRAEATEFLQLNAGSLLDEVNRHLARLQAQIDKLPELEGVSDASTAIAAGGKAVASWEKFEEFQAQQGPLLAARVTLSRYKGAN